MISSENRCALFRTCARGQSGKHVTIPQLDGEIRDGRHHMQVRVYYEDTDFALMS
jgi:hypothetical protein